MKTGAPDQPERPWQGFQWGHGLAAAARSPTIQALVAGAVAHHNRTAGGARRRVALVNRDELLFTFHLAQHTARFTHDVVAVFRFRHLRMAVAISVAVAGTGNRGNRLGVGFFEFDIRIGVGR